MILTLGSWTLSQSECVFALILLTDIYSPGSETTPHYGFDLVLYEPPDDIRELMSEYASAIQGNSMTIADELSYRVQELEVVASRCNSSDVVTLDDLRIYEHRRGSLFLCC